MCSGTGLHTLYACWAIPLLAECANWAIPLLAECANYDNITLIKNIIVKILGTSVSMDLFILVDTDYNAIDHSSA